MDLAAAYNQNAEKVTGTFYDNAISQPYKAMEFFWAKYKFTDDLAVSALVMNIEVQSRLDSSITFTNCRR